MKNTVPKREGAGLLIPNCDALHPAVEAWARHGLESSIASVRDVLKEEQKTLLCRLRVRDGKAEKSVIAKRADREVIETETIVYRDILGSIPVSSPRFFGTVEDNDGRLRWIFLEDVGDACFVAGNAQHRSLLSSWLGTMNTAAADAEGITRLSEQSVSWYFDQLDAGASRIAENYNNSAIGEHDRTVLDDILRSFDIIASHRDEVLSYCDEMPKTLVHGDIAPKNLRLITADGATMIMPIDWETAARTTPAADLSYHVDIAEYHAAVVSRWPEFSRSDWQRLAHYGKLFRVIGAIEWATYDLRFSWVAKAIVYLGVYVAQLDEALSLLQWSRAGSPATGILRSSH